LPFFVVNLRGRGDRWRKKGKEKKKGKRSVVFVNCPTTALPSPPPLRRGGRGGRKREKKRKKKRAFPSVIFEQAFFRDCEPQFQEEKEKKNGRNLAFTLLLWNAQLEDLLLDLILLKGKKRGEKKEEKEKEVSRNRDFRSEEGEKKKRGKERKLGFRVPFLNLFFLRHFPAFE